MSDPFSGQVLTFFDQDFSNFVQTLKTPLNYKKKKLTYCTYI